MYLLLRADQRQKQNHKDVLLPAHLQELYPSGKESGLILSQKIIRPSRGRVQWQKAEETKNNFQYYTDPSGQEFRLRALQGHSGRNRIDPSLQDNVVIPDGFFKYIYHVGCAINLHSVMNSGLIPGGQKFWAKDRRYSSRPWILLDAPRLAWYTQKTWKKHQNTVYWGRHQTCSKERI